MVMSMTGYGRGENTDLISFIVELRSVNHRFLEIRVRLPKPWLLLEEKIKNYIKKRISRGRIDVFVNFEAESLPIDVKIDKNVVKNYYKMLVELKSEIGFEGPIDLSLLSMLTEAFYVQEQVPEQQELWVLLQPALQEALDNLVNMKLKEGETLWHDTLMRLNIIEDNVAKIQNRADIVPGEYRQRLLQDVKSLSEGIQLDNDRLEIEVALFAEKSNITEEIVRLKSHISQMRETAYGKGSIGKKMDFIVQEMIRETNTIGSKSSDNDITRNVIEIKSELEKIREQIQNIE